MKPYCASSILVITIFMIFQATSANNFINSTCATLANGNGDVYQPECTTALQAAPASGCATLRGLGAISIRLLRDNITDTRCYIKQLSKQGNLDQNVKQLLSDCFVLFSNAIPATKQARRNYNMNKFDDAYVQIRSVIDASGACEDRFNAKRGVIHPLTKRVNDVYQLSSVVIAIMRVIQKGSG